MSATQFVESRADELAPAVIDSLGGLVRFLSRPWVRKIVRVVLWLVLGGLPAWVVAMVDFLLQMAPALHNDVVKDLTKFRALLVTLDQDTPPEVLRHVPIPRGNASPFKDPAKAYGLARRIAQGND